MTAVMTPNPPDDMLPASPDAQPGTTPQQVLQRRLEELAQRVLKMSVPRAWRVGLLARRCLQQQSACHTPPRQALATHMPLLTGVGPTCALGTRRSMVCAKSPRARCSPPHGETGNDLPLFLSTTTAERVDGGYKFNGHKMFGSLTPVWTRLGIHAMTADGQIVHAFMPRDTPGYTIKETWDTLGMRATRSDDTLLQGAIVKDQYIARVLPAGSADLFVLSVFAWAEPTFGSIYLGLAKRAMDIAAETAHKRKALALTRSFAYHPEVQHNIAQMTFRFDAAEACRRRSPTTGPRRDHGGLWTAKLISAKHNAVEAAKDIVDRAMAIPVARAWSRERTERLPGRARGGFHPAKTLLAPDSSPKSSPARPGSSGAGLV